MAHATIGSSFDPLQHVQEFHLLLRALESEASSFTKHAILLMFHAEHLKTCFVPCTSKQNMHGTFCSNSNALQLVSRHQDDVYARTPFADI